MKTYGNVVCWLIGVYDGELVVKWIVDWASQISAISRLLFGHISIYQQFASMPSLFTLSKYPGGFIMMPVLSMSMRLP